MTAATWSTHQLAEFVAALSQHRDVPALLVGAVERIAEAVEAEVALVLQGSEVSAAVGFPRRTVPPDLLARLLSSAGREPVDVPDVGSCQVAVATVEDHDVWLVVARASPDPFGASELALLRAMSRVLAQTVTLLGVLEREREHQRLLERLSRIQRSISHRAPLQEVLDSITSGARDVLGDEAVTLRLIDPDDPGLCYVASYAGLPAETFANARHIPLGQGVGGRAITENALVIVDDYTTEPNVVPALRDLGFTTAMAAPVHENDRVVGSLVVSSRVPGRRYSEKEQDALRALAEHTSLALTDAMTVDAMREAQRSKDLFLAMVSHELKTPLTVIMGALRTLQQYGGNLSEQLRHEMLATAYGRGQELERLIDRLLRGARAELAGAAHPVPLDELVRDALAGFGQVRRLVVSVPSDTVVVDEAAVRDVVGILVENATSHSPAGSPILVTATVAGELASVAVVNQGELPAGVDPASLFLPFQRGHAATSSGVGLGLYIAARLAGAMGGHIEPESAHGQVTFTLSFPRSAPGAHTTPHPVLLVSPHPAP